MNRSLYTKLVLIILLIIVCLMSVAGLFLVREVRNFYLEDFYQQMQTVFSGGELAADLRGAASGEDAAVRMAEILRIYSGQLGIDSGERDYYVLSGASGSFLTGSSPVNDQLEVTPNILTALTGREGYAYDSGADYMDVALPIRGEDETDAGYIVYIRDNKAGVQALSSQLLRIILEALLIGLLIAVLLGLLLAKTVVAPIQSLTRAAERMAEGDFANKPENPATDEIGTFTRTFNNMAGQLEKSIDDMRRSEQTRREFVANVSHELRTPITSVRSYAETLVDSDDLDPETRKAFLGVILNESDRMTKIVQDLLTLSRFDAGNFSFSFDHFSFVQSVEGVYKAVQMEAQKQGYDFRLELEPEIPEIRGDKARIEQVLLNMVTNAMKYTQAGGRIVIAAGVREDKVWCSVQDNGIGIPEKDVERVFERFYRVDKARSRESGGTGLGLSIAREIVTRHDGEICLKSKLGEGTVITMTLPVGGPSDAG